MKETVSSFRGLTGVCTLLSRPILADTDSGHTAGFDRYLKARSVNVIAAHPPTYHKYDNYLSSSLQAAYSFASDRAKIKAVILCNPHNPLSRCYPKRAIIECIEFCQERNLHLISDEIYALAQLGGTPKYEHEFVSALSLTEPLMRDGAIKVDPSRVHVVWSASKLFGSSGFRIVRSDHDTLHYSFLMILRAVSFRNRIRSCAVP